MAAQVYVRRSQDEIVKRARDLYRQEQDEATQQALNKAYEAVKRARALLNELREI